MFARVVRNPNGRVQQEGGAIDAIEWLMEWGHGVRSGGQSILIFGERGSGKTWILRSFAARQLKQHRISPWTTPPAFYLPLREYAGILRSAQGLRKTLSYFFHDQYPSMGPSHLYFWEAVIESGAAILLLDGFDELAREVSVDGMVRHLERLSFLLPGNARVVLTTRGTVFPSLTKMVEVFSGVAPASDRSEMTGEEFLRQEDVAVSVRARSIYSIIPFSPVDLVKLARKKRLIRWKDRLDGDAVPLGTPARETPGAEGSFADLLSEHSRLVTGDKSILAACLKLGEIPACANFMMTFLEQLQEDDEPVPLIRLFEMSLIGPLVSYNVALDRALVSFTTRRYEPARDPKAAITIDKDLDVAKKLSVLEFIAWKLIESRQSEFTSDYIAAAALDSPEADFKAVVNDLRSQTVFDFSDEGVGLDFRLWEIQTYFGARGISSLLWNPVRRREGIRGSAATTGRGPAASKSNSSSAPSSECSPCTACWSSRPSRRPPSNPRRSIGTPIC